MRKAYLGIIPLLLGIVLGILWWSILVDPSPVQAIPPQPMDGVNGVADNHAMTHVATRFSTTTIWLPTYPYSKHLSTAYNPTYNITYTVLDWDNYRASEPISVAYTLLVLENDYLKVTILPELGGRVYQMIHKATGHNVLYQNPVIKPTRWGPTEQGWWLAVGGIEWGLPVEEHGYEWGVPWNWTAITSSRGVTVTVWDTEALDRLRARIDLFLPRDRAYLAVTPHLENPTEQPIDYKFWLNASLAPGGKNKPSSELAFIFNAEQVTVHSTGDPRLLEAHPGNPTGPDYQISWPVSNDVDYSRLGNWDGWFFYRTLTENRTKAEENGNR